MAIVLLITPENGKLIELPILGKCSIGRSSSCDLKLDDTKMSGKHGLFEITPKGELFYTDLGSTNGSFCNDSQIQKIQFKIHEVLMVGNTSITIDLKRLSPSEQQSIGYGVKNSKFKGLALPKEINEPVKKPLPPKQEDKSAVKKGIVLNKDHKKARKPASDWASGGSDNILEQEESSGQTKMLKLDTNKLKKK